MIYRNKQTGAVIEVSSEIVGGGWEPVEDTLAAAASEKDGKPSDTAEKAAKTVKSKARTKK